MVVTILRLGSLADFHFVTVSVEKSEINVDEEFDEVSSNVNLFLNLSRYVLLIRVYESVEGPQNFYYYSDLVLGNIDFSHL